MATKNAIDSNAPIEVTKGGTGASTLTTKGVLVGSNTSAVRALTAGSNGQLLIGSAGADPVFASLTSSTMTFTNGANTKNIDIKNYVDKGTFVPTLQFGGASVNMTYATQTGVYIRFFGQLLFQIDIVLTAKGTSTGSATVQTLPVAISGANGPVSLRIYNVTMLGNLGAIIGPVNATTISLYYGVSGAIATSLTDANFADTSVLTISGSYITT